MTLSYIIIVTLQKRFKKLAYYYNIMKININIIIKNHILEKYHHSLNKHVL